MRGSSIIAASAGTARCSSSASYFDGFSSCCNRRGTAQLPPKSMLCDPPMSAAAALAPIERCKRRGRCCAAAAMDGAGSCVAAGWLHGLFKGLNDAWHLCRCGQRGRARHGCNCCADSSLALATGLCWPVLGSMLAQLRTRRACSDRLHY
jgi:hypothetical protein